MLMESPLLESNLSQLPQGGALTTDSRQKKPLLLLTLDLGNGKYDNIEVWENSSPEDVAAKFCKKHGLPAGVASALEHKIGENIKDLMAEKRSQKSREELDIRGQINPDKDGRDMKARGGQNKQESTEKDLSPSNQSNSHLIPSLPSKKANSAEDDLVIEFPEAKHEYAQKRQDAKDLKRNKSEKSFNKGSKMSSPTKDFNKRMTPMSSGFRDFEPQNTGGVYHRLQQDVKNRALRQKSAHAKEELYDNASFSSKKNPYNRTLTPKAHDKSMASTAGFSTSYKRSESGLNPGERLYLSNKLKKEEREKNLKKYLDEQKKKEDKKNLTFHPKIDHNSFLMVTREFEPTQSHLLKSHQQKEHKLDMKRREKYLKEKDSCTFRPSLSLRTSQLVKSYSARMSPTKNHDDKDSMVGTSTQATSLFHSLYNEAEERKKRHEELTKKIDKEICPFQPKPELIDKKVKKDDAEELYKRLATSKDAFNAEILEKRKEKDHYEQNVDKKTGQKLFSPKISTPKAVLNKRQRSLTTNEFLYMSVDATREKKELQKKQNEEKILELSKKKLSHERSSKIVEKVKQKRYKELFDMMDSNKDGVITASDVDINGFNSKVLNALSPFLLDLDKSQKSLDFVTFCSTLDSNMQKLTVDQKNDIAGPNREYKNRPQIEFGFSPHLSDRSRSLASRKRGDSANDSRIEFMLSEKKGHTERMLEKREKSLNRELTECTFTPNSDRKMRTSKSMAAIKQITLSNKNLTKEIENYFEEEVNDF